MPGGKSGALSSFERVGAAAVGAAAVGVLPAGRAEFLPRNETGFRPSWRTMQIENLWFFQWRDFQGWRIFGWQDSERKGLEFRV